MSKAQTTTTYKDFIEQQEQKDKIREILGESGISFLHQSLQIVQKDINLMKADNTSIFNSVCVIASLGLFIEPSFGHASINHYKIKDGLIWKTYAQFQIGYKGLIQLSLRSNQFKGLNSEDVREGEYLGTNRMTGEISFNWNPDQDKRKKLKVIGYVAYFSLLSGFEKSMFYTVKEMTEHGRKWSKNFLDKDSFWQKDFDGMGKKTTLKLLLEKYAPKSAEMKKAIRYDQAIIEDDGNLNYADNPNGQKKLSLEESNRAIIEERTINYINSAKTLEALENCFESVDSEKLSLAYEKKKQELKTKE